MHRNFQVHEMGFEVRGQKKRDIEMKFRIHNITIEDAQKELKVAPEFKVKIKINVYTLFRLFFQERLRDRNLCLSKQNLKD